MQVRNFVGKRVGIDEMKWMTGAAQFYDAGEYDDTDFAVAVIPLVNYDCDITDRFGYSDYSMAVHLDGDRIHSLVRVGHVHMCGQGMDDELRRFPHKSLEKEAEVRLAEVLMK